MYCLVVDFGVSIDHSSIWNRLVRHLFLCPLIYFAVFKSLHMLFIVLFDWNYNSFFSHSSTYSFLLDCKALGETVNAAKRIHRSDGGGCKCCHFHLWILPTWRKCYHFLAFYLEAKMCLICVWIYDCGLLES